ncbi:hypothetical protein PTW37_14425 [Arthrobacter agilis]|uniref:DUF7793 family protein n=1 Tax=Arthrobacter agilis TaxID=37921 RepID=UPI0023669C14|nr:hypothetical protein [Arthrobacter agilis]WDF33029.1 hypothetical protein PTW37_14425 [Arthrobacter agilis]
MAGDAGEQPRFTLTDDGDVLRLAWAAGVTIEASDVRETMAAVTAASPHGKRPLLVRIGLVDAISLEARHLLIEDTCSLRTGVVGVDEVGRVLTAFNYRSVTPSRFFTDESDAIAWLTGRADAGDTTSRASEEANPFCAQLEGGVAVVRWEHGVSVSTAAAEALVAGVAALAPGERPPMLALNNSMVSLTPGAFEVFAHRLSVSALAIVGAEGDSVIAAYYKQKHKPPYPTRFFGTAAEGRTWLLQGRARPGPQDS